MLLSRLSAPFCNRWVHLDTVFRPGQTWIFGHDIQETQFWGSKMEVHIHLKNAFPGGIRNRVITWDTKIVQSLVCFWTLPVSNRWPSIWISKKDIVGERGLLETAFPMIRWKLTIFLIQPIAFGLSLNLNLPGQSQSHWFLFKGSWQKRPRTLDHRLKFENEEMTLQMQQAIHQSGYIYCVFPRPNVAARDSLYSYRDW